MTSFIFFLFLFSIFFTFDNKPINLLLDFIGIILSVSFYLLLFNSFDLSFFSFIFIIIYGSALAILFAFILMLFNKPFFLFNISNPSFNSFSPFKFILSYANSNFKLLHLASLFYSYFPYAIATLFISCFSYIFLSSLEYNISIYYILYPISNINISFIYYIYNSFLLNPIPLILIINILLLGLIGAVFLLI